MLTTLNKGQLKLYSDKDFDGSGPIFLIMQNCFLNLGSISCILCFLCFDDKEANLQIVQTETCS